MLQKISKLKEVKKTRFCGGTGGIPINWPQSQCSGYGIQWYNGQCYACY